jgi:carboxyl-terminal processing protease
MVSSLEDNHARWEYAPTIVAGPATPYVLDDSSILTLPARHELAADHELINCIGVAPDYYLPRTAEDVSTGHDPDLAKALNLLTP